MIGFKLLAAFLHSHLRTQIAGGFVSFNMRHIGVIQNLATSVGQ